MGDYKATQPVGEENDDEWGPIALRWLLRVLLPIVISIVPKVLFLWLRDHLAWATVLRGSDVLTLALTLSMAALIDLFAKLLPVSHRLWHRWSLLAISALTFFLFVSLVLRIIHGWLTSGLISAPEDFFAIERAEIAGVGLSLILFVLSVALAVAERRWGFYRKGPGSDGGKCL